MSLAMIWRGCDDSVFPFLIYVCFHQRGIYLRHGRFERIVDTKLN